MLIEYLFITRRNSSNQTKVQPVNTYFECKIVLEKQRFYILYIKFICFCLFIIAHGYNNMLVLFCEVIQI